MKKKAADKKKKRTTFAIVLITALLAGFLFFQTSRLQRTEEGYRRREAELSSELEVENRKTEELKKQGVLIRSLKYIEQIAREKLGLVYPGEILVEPEE